MKRRRGILIGIALLVIVAVVAVALAFNASFQTRVVQRVLSEQPDMAASLSRVSVGWSTVRIDDLAVRRDGMVLRAPRVEATLPVWRLLTNRVELRRLVAHDWELQIDPAVAIAAMRAPEPPVASNAAEAGWGGLARALGGSLVTADGGHAAPGLGGLLDALHLPLDIAVDELDLRGTAAWRQAGPGADGHANVAVTGGGLRAGETGTFHLLVEAEGERATAAGIRSLLIDARLGLTLADAHTLDHVRLAAELAGRRDERATPDRFELQFDLRVAEGSPHAAFSLRDEHNRLVHLDLRREENDATLSGTWSIALNDRSLGSLMLGRTLPSFASEGQGALSAAIDLSSGSVGGTLAFTGSDFAVLMPELSQVGPVSGELTFDTELRETGLRLTQLDLAVNGAAPLLSAHLLQGIEVAHQTNEIRVAQPDDPVFSLNLLGLPISWAQPWLDPYVLDGRPVQGGFVGMVSPHGLRVVTTDELHLPGMVLAEEGRTLVDEIDVTLRVGAEFTAEGWQVELDRLDLLDAEGPVATFSARGGRLTRENDVMKLAGRFESSLRIIERVPQLASALALRTGRVEGEFGLGLEDRVSLAASVAATELMLAEGQRMPDMQVDGRIDLFRGGAIEAHLPMRFTMDDRVSDLTLNVSAASRDTGWQAEGSLSGPRAYVSDLQGLGLILAVAPDAPASVENAPTPASGPVWAGWQGTFKTAIGELTLPNGLVLENIRGDIELDASQLNLSGLSASMAGGGEVQIDGGLDYDATRGQNYEAKGQMRAEGVDVGAILRAIDPDQVPTLEGRLDFNADLNSAVNDLADLVGQAAIEARVTSAGGVLRALQVDVQQYIEAGRTLAVVGGLVAALSGNQEIGRRAQRLEALTQVADQLSALAFDQLNLELNRAPGGNLVLRDLAVISPGLRLLGNGSIVYEEGTPIWMTPLALTLQLAAREEIGALLGRLNLTKPDADALGYRPLVQAVHLDGSLSQVGTAELGRLLSRALR